MLKVANINKIIIHYMFRVTAIIGYKYVVTGRLQCMADYLR